MVAWNCQGFHPTPSSALDSPWECRLHFSTHFSSLLAQILFQQRAFPASLRLTGKTLTKRVFLGAVPSYQSEEQVEFPYH